LPTPDGYTVIENVAERAPERNRDRPALDSFLPPLILLTGFVARLIPAKKYFLNPDEALHYLAASEPSLRLAYKAALTNAHPPLLIVLLHFWQALGHSELVLRMPSVLAGTACCWLFYLWLADVSDRSVALHGLLLMTFAPSLIALSSEVRQYALLLFFATDCLFLSERAIRKNSWPLMMLFSLSLYGALITHYSALLFAFSMGAYMLARLLHCGKSHRNLFAVWAAGQIAAVGLIAYFLWTHVRHLKAAGMPQEIAETWLRRSIFHPGERNAAAFTAVQTLRVFTYLFSHGFVGALALLAFLVGAIALLRRKSTRDETGPSARELATLFIVPFLANCVAAFAGIYPYGGTRHNAILAPFALGGGAVGLAMVAPRAWSSRVKLVVIIALLALCNFFPAPPPLIKARNHSTALMTDAISYLQKTAPRGSVIFADYESALVLGYYACGHGIVQIFPPVKQFAKADCSSHTVISARPEEWRFKADNLRSELASAAASYGLERGTKVWLFDAGWINDLAPAISRSSDCLEPHFFGENILICRLTVAYDAVRPASFLNHGKGKLKTRATSSGGATER
jgi:hypothetical protein